MKKRILFLVVVIAATIVFVGCQGGTAAVGKAAPGPFGKYDPPITITYVLPGIDGVEFNAENTAEDNLWTRGWKDELGIVGKMLWATTGAQFRQKWEATVASGDLPDIIPLGDIDFEKFQKAGKLADLTKAYDKYASPLMKEYLSRDKGEALKQVSVGGKLYAIPWPNGVGEFSQMIWLRDDWLKKVGMAAPTTMDEFIAVATAFAKNDPDGNGKADTIGISINKDLFYGFGWCMSGIDIFFNAYRAYPTQWLVDASGKKLVYGGIQPEVKAALASLQKLYAEGVVDPEFGTTDSQKVVEEATAGRMGLLLNCWWAPEYPLIFNRQKDPKADWQCYRMVSADDKPSKVFAESGRVGGSRAVRKGYGNPEAMVKMFNYMLKMLYETTPETFAKVMPVKFACPTVFDAPFAQIQICKAISVALKGGSTEKLNGEEYARYLEAKKFLDGDQNFWHTYFQYTDKTVHLDGRDGPFDIVQRDLLDGDGLMRDAYMGPATASQVANQATLDKMLKETYTKIITGAPLSEFDAFVENWKKLGGDEISKEVNDWFSTQKK
jgi:putative aldouronate transport system substrate-binding protein